MLPPRQTEYHGSFSGDDSAAEESDDELPMLVRLINARVNTRVQFRPKSKVYKQLLETRVKWTHVDPQANEFWEHDFGSLCDHYDESAVFRAWVVQRLKYAVDKLDSRMQAGAYQKAMLAMISNFQHEKYGYWTFRRECPNIANEPCEIRFRAAVKREQKERQEYVPEFTLEERQIALQYLTSEEVWYLRLEAIGYGGWRRMLSDQFPDTLETYAGDWGRNYPQDVEYGQPVPGNLTPGTQHVLGLMQARATEAKERILSELPELEYKP